MYGNEFLNITGGIGFGFYSETQMQLKHNDMMYWRNKVRQRVIFNLRNRTNSHNDVILKHIYTQCPIPSCINRKGTQVKITQVYPVKCNPSLDRLIKQVREQYPDAEYCGILIDAGNAKLLKDEKKGFSRYKQTTAISDKIIQRKLLKKQQA